MPSASTFRLCGSGCQNRVRLTCASLSATTYTSVLISRPSGAAFCKIHRSTQREPGPKPARSHRKEPIQETLMTYQRDPDRPIQPRRDRESARPAASHGSTARLQTDRRKCQRWLANGRNSSRSRYSRSCCLVSSRSGGQAPRISLTYRCAGTCDAVADNYCAQHQCAEVGITISLGDPHVCGGFLLRVSQRR
jgi:hypothetical protein